MPDTVSIEDAVSLPDDLDGLVAASTREGYRFVSRLRDDWRAGGNRFDRPGERLVIARSKGVLVGIGGLNVDPYASEPRIGRLRHLYVREAFRGRGTGGAIVRHLLASARGPFDAVRLRTADEAAGRFYEAFGFVATADPFATHERTVIVRP